MKQVEYKMYKLHNFANFFCVFFVDTEEILNCIMLNPAC